MIKHNILLKKKKNLKIKKKTFREQKELIT